MGKTAPSPTPATETAAAQTSTNLSTAIANNIMGQQNQYGPDGSSVEYTKTGSESVYDPFTDTSYDIPTYDVTTTLSARNAETLKQNELAQQNLARTANQQSGFLEDYLAGSVDTSGAPDLVSTYAGADDFSADRQRVEDALFERLNGQINDDRAAMDASLAAKGIDIGSAAYSDAQADFGQNVNDARIASILNAGQEQARLVNMAQQAASFQNASRAQSLEEMFAERAQPINEIGALLSGSQVTMPNFSTYQPSQMPTTNTAGIIGANDAARMQAWQQSQAALGSTIGGLGALFL